MKKLLLATALIATTSPAVSKAILWSDLTPQEKQKVVRKVNKEFAGYSGLAIDEITTLERMVLLPTGKMGVTFSVDLEYYGNTLEDIKGFKGELMSGFTNEYCTTPDVRGFMDMGIPVEIKYVSTKGIYIMEMGVNSSQCRKANL